MTAEYQVHGDVAVISLNNPPVNGLGLSTRQAIVDGLEKAENDAAVKAIVLTGAGKAFSGGADIREFGSPKAIQEPNLLSVIIRVENTKTLLIPERAGNNLACTIATSVGRPDPFTATEPLRPSYCRRPLLRRSEAGAPRAHAGRPRRKRTASPSITEHRQPWPSSENRFHDRMEY